MYITLTADSNLNHIRETTTLIPAATLMERAGRVDLKRAEKKGS
jgi:hypothetical protein